MLFIGNRLKALLFEVHDHSLVICTNRILVIMKEQNFFDVAANYFMEMLSEDSERRQLEFRRPIRNMITIMSEIITKNPTSVTQTIGQYDIVTLSEKTRLVEEKSVFS